MVDRQGFATAQIDHLLPQARYRPYRDEPDNWGLSWPIGPEDFVRVTNNLLAVRHLVAFWPESQQNRSFRTFPKVAQLADRTVFRVTVRSSRYGYWRSAV